MGLLEILPKEYASAIIAGVFSVLGIIAGAVFKHMADRRSHHIELEKLDDSRRDRDRTEERARSAAESQDLSARLRLIMDGYENQIKGLTAEVALVKAERDRVEKEYDERLDLCHSCPHYIELRRAQNARPT